MPKISVIVPVYNVEKYLNRCVDSILSQTFTDFELLLIDDGSKDNSGKICDEYAEKDKRVKVFHKENGGVSRARNLGIENAEGEYVAFVDSDDYVSSTYLDYLYKFKNDCELVICGVNYCYNFSDNKMPQRNLGNYCVKFNSENASVIAELLKDRKLNYVYAKLFLSRIIKEKKIEFNEKISLGEDTVFVAGYLKYVDNIFVVGDCLYDYIKNGNDSLTQKFYSNIFDIYMDITDAVEKTFIDKNIYGETVSALNYRRLLSGLWAIDSIVNQKIKKKEKIILLDGVFNNPKYVNAYDYMIKNGLIYDFDVIIPQNGKKYLKGKERNDRINKIKSLICKICPKFLIKIYKRKRVEK